MPLEEACNTVSISTVRSSLVLVKNSIDEKGDDDPVDLRKLSPRHKRWDERRTEADEIEAILLSSADPRHQRAGERVGTCSQVLEFSRSPPVNGKSKLKLEHAFACKVRLCPVCMWRRSIRYQAIVYAALPDLIRDYPDSQFLFLTLTLRNCPVEKLRDTLQLMGRAWVRLTQLRCFPARGWVRTLEVTRSKKDRSSHPHFHCLLVVAPAYFQGDYLQQHQWAELWQQCLRIPYRPVVDIRKVKLALDPTTTGRVTAPPTNLWSAVAEIVKYGTKPSDLIRDPEWLLSLTDQLRGIRAIAVGGLLKHYIRDRNRDKRNAKKAEEEAPPLPTDSLFFGWNRPVKRYKRITK